MRRAILGVKLVILLLWTLFCLGTYGLLNLIGDGLIRHSDVVPVAPEGVEFISWLLLLLQRVGFGLVIGGWILGVIVILLVAWLARRLAPPARPPQLWEPPAPQREHDPARRRLPEPEA